MIPVDMRAHIDAIRVLLAPAGYPVHFIEVPDAPEYPYVLLWASGRMEPDALCDEVEDLNDILGVTAVGLSAEGVLEVQRAIRPRLHDAAPPVAGRSATLRYFDSQPVQVDRDVTIPASNRHPKFGVDLYRLRSVPA
ncbi:hypothetical protein [Oerskovia turbata]